ncbi:MAG: hypothetical protein GXX10_01875 [Clostridiaceae bacterium]|nr:hypothetical protein [Clostridiaceae bacterium]
MNGRNNTSRLRIFIDTAAKKFTGMNKGSKILLKVGSFVFFAFLIVALVLCVLYSIGFSAFNGQYQLIEWTVLYSFRFWVMIVIGAFILDYLVRK